MPDLDAPSRGRPRSATDCRPRASGTRRGENGARTSANGNGARSARTTAQNGDAWNYFPHDQARSRAYHWGEDGLAGFSDLKQRLCFAVALWNGHDPILKERLFGLSNGEGNHGEDVKEYYFYLDSTPTHSYMKWLYKYPQAAFPYGDLIATNARPLAAGYEYELIDTGVFDDDRYFDVVVEYFKASPEECFVRITATNRGPETAAIHVLPTLWFRNTWSWWPGPEKPILSAAEAPSGTSLVAACHPELGPRWLYCDEAPSLLFTENETNNERLFSSPNATPFVKDAFHAFVVNGDTNAVNPARTGTKAAAHYRLEVGAGQSVSVRLCLTDTPATKPFAAFDTTLAARRQEADEFYRSCTPESASEDRTAIMRQAFGGLFWTKQYYFFDVNMWLREHGVNPFDGPSSIAGPEPPVVPHVQRRRDLDAGQVGVSVVRRLGSRLSRGGDGARRSGFRQASARP